ncbi:hypothetical protein L1785_01370 [Antribacter sp. KLBMP9083]|uniref:Uncharacterized protein n=1 Tax=Antribacter soli TaxID=2910976 RepID=A0AA41U5R3_9MICO|nr:hypothetical protein [Antribacter soli]MCF4119626.1 hypothetical protein [Antribacter soli]
MILRSRRVAARTAAVAVTGLTLALLLSACGSDGEPDAEASGTPSVTVTEPQSDDGPLNANEACAAMYVYDDEHLADRVAAALLDVSQDGLDPTMADRMHALAIDLGRLQDRVPEEFRDPIAQIRVPFVQVQEKLDAMDGGDLQLDIGAATEGLRAYEALC